MEKYYCFAGLELAIYAPDVWMYTEERTLEPFRTDTVADPHRFTFEMVEALTPPCGEHITTQDNFVVYREVDGQVRYTGAVAGNWEKAYLRVAHNGKTHSAQMKAETYRNGMSAKTVLNAVEAEHLIARNGGFLFHSSYIRVGNQAVLFTAPSGTGKSTQADLWHTYRKAEIINGDRSAVRCTDDGVFACGIPFAGSSEICKNVILPLAAIVYLKQAPQTTIRRLRGAESFRRIWEGCSVNTWDRIDVAQVSETVSNVLMAVPVYELACTPDESAILALEGVLKE